MGGVIVGGESPIETSKDLGYGREKNHYYHLQSLNFPRGEALVHGNPWERTDASVLSSKVTWKLCDELANRHAGQS